jgi:hypothetical protein
MRLNCRDHRALKAELCRDPGNADFDAEFELRRIAIRISMSAEEVSQPHGGLRERARNGNLLFQVTHASLYQTRGRPGIVKYMEEAAAAQAVCVSLGFQSRLKWVD